MLRRSLPLLALALAAAATPASAFDQNVVICSGTVVRGVGGNDVGEIDGDAVAYPGGVPAVSTLTCSLQVGGSGYASDADDVVASNTGYAAVVAAPYSVPASSETLWVCTSLTITDAAGHTETRHWDGSGWTADASAARCAPALETNRR